jgi:PleD family two-component response regulator
VSTATDYDRLFETADKRLYEAKAAGRNCVVGERPAAPNGVPGRLAHAN